MIRSMTAFASQEATIDTLTLICELRSVNHRYCDLFLKLPEPLRFTELNIRSGISKTLKRGKIDCSLSYKKNTGNQSFNVNEDAVTSLLNATHEIELQMQNASSFSALDVLNFPGIQQEPEIDKNLLERGVQELLDKTLSQLLDTRKTEGRQLGLLITDRCTLIHSLIDSAREFMPVVLKKQRSKFNEKIKELVADPDYDRLEQELVFLTQKMDIEEELDRLSTHTHEVLRVLGLDEPIGRRLDFLMQEMNREANTLGSKSADQEITRISIELKVLIEQIREQVQNIE